jgi:hypothetical protein
MNDCPNFICFGSISELRKRVDANLIAICPGRNWDSDYRVKRYASRLALETFLKNPGNWKAIVKTQVDKGMLLYPAFQTDSL